ncbi:MAG: hypothetical protein KBG48_27595 [Kofleriaceae bacterium]|jgi:hypothetical protein|nr:hypothetical protein [Kofleriaceae bacterium]MBP9171195.1 hypothetical protein [Kofleriaceae bacterium]MBP9860405.1 hypothetical protein [Kofleriaceae bacterium]
MHKPNDLEHNLRTLVEAKVLNLDVSLATIVNAGALAGLEPWEVFCGNGWIVRRRWPGPVPQFDREAIGAVVREELTSAGVLKGVR